MYIFSFKRLSSPLSDFICQNKTRHDKLALRRQDGVWSAVYMYYDLKTECLGQGWIERAQFCVTILELKNCQMIQNQAER